MILCGNCGEAPAVHGSLCRMCEAMAAGAVLSLLLGLGAFVWGAGRSLALIVVEVARVW